MWSNEVAKVFAKILGDVHEALKNRYESSVFDDEVKTLHRVYSELDFVLNVQGRTLSRKEFESMLRDYIGVPRDDAVLDARLYEMLHKDEQMALLHEIMNLVHHYEAKMYWSMNEEELEESGVYVNKY